MAMGKEHPDQRDAFAHFLLFVKMMTDCQLLGTRFIPHAIPREH